jgi:hypothetical protein
MTFGLPLKYLQPSSVFDGYQSENLAHEIIQISFHYFDLHGLGQ